MMMHLNGAQVCPYSNNLRDLLIKHGWKMVSLDRDAFMINTFDVKGPWTRVKVFGILTKVSAIQRVLEDNSTFVLNAQNELTLMSNEYFEKGSFTTINGITISADTSTRFRRELEALTGFKSVVVEV